MPGAFQAFRPRRSMHSKVWPCRSPPAGFGVSLAELLPGPGHRLCGMPSTRGCSGLRALPQEAATRRANRPRVKLLPRAMWCVRGRSRKASSAAVASHIDGVPRPLVFLRLPSLDPLTSHVGHWAIGMRCVVGDRSSILRTPCASHGHIPTQPISHIAQKAAKNRIGIDVRVLFAGSWISSLVLSSGGGAAHVRHAPRPPWWAWRPLRFRQWRRGLGIMSEFGLLATKCSAQVDDAPPERSNREVTPTAPWHPPHFTMRGEVM